jgi:hypothetical protein
MPHPKTVKKVVSLLRQLKKHLPTEKYFDLTQTLRDNKIPHDYGKILSEENVLIKINGGSRGLVSYVWNKDKLPNAELAEIIVSAYNKKRNDQKAKRQGGSSKITNENRLIDIQNMLKLVLQKLPE